MPLYDKPPRFRPGQKHLSARALNHMIEMDVRQVRGGPGVSVDTHGDRIVIGSLPEGKGELKRTRLFVVKQEFDDFLLCAPAYAGSENPELQSVVYPDPPVHDPDLAANAQEFYVYVAKPRILQRTPWDNQSLFVNGRNKTFNYPGNNSGDTYPPTNDHIPGRREVIYDGGETVIEVIDEAYFPGDIILAVRRPTGLDNPALDPNNYLEGRPDLVWQDVNEGARRWVGLDVIPPEPPPPEDCPCDPDTEWWLEAASDIEVASPALSNQAPFSMTGLCLVPYNTCSWYEATFVIRNVGWYLPETDPPYECNLVQFILYWERNANQLWLDFVGFPSSGFSCVLARWTIDAASVDCNGANTLVGGSSASGLTVPSTVTLTANACEAPPTSGSGSEDCAGERVGNGSDAGKGTGSATVSGVATAIDDIVIVSVAQKGTGTVTVDIDGTNIPQRATDGFGLSFGLKVFALKVNTAYGGVNVTVTSSSSSDSLAVTVDVLTGASSATGAPLAFVYRTGTSTEPEAPMGAHTADACNFLLGVVATNGPAADADGTWQNNFADGGQDIGTTGGADTDNVRICTGTNFPPFDYNSPVKKTGITSRQWICGWFEWVME